MGKASSSKKVARAARAGGRSTRARQRNLLFPGAIAAIVIAGTGLIWYAADERKNDTQEPPVAFDDHWHAAYGIYICDTFQPALPEFHEPNNIHTHGDGVIHIHPFAESASGANARLGVFLDGAGIEMSDDSLTVNDETWTEGEDQCDGEDAELVVAQWTDVQAEDTNPALIGQDFGDLRFREDGEGYVIAFVPEGTDIPKPETAANLQELGAIDSAETDEGLEEDVPATTGTDTTGTTGGTTDTTAGAGEPAGEPSATTAPEGGTATTAGDSTTTTGG